MNRNRVTVIDGSFSTQLSKHVGIVDGDPLWSSRFNATNPDAVIQTHLDFLRAGAEVILTNTYQSSVEGYVEHLKLDRNEAIALIKASVQLAHVAKERFLKEDQSNKEPQIIASIGPYGAHLHDASEYTGSYADNITVEALKKWHRVRINAVLQAGVDGLAIETIPCRIEADALFDLLYDEYPLVKFWISFQCKDGSTLAHGENFAETVRNLFQKARTHKRGPGNLLAVGVNCTHPAHVTSLFESVNGGVPANERMPLIVYPNSGEIFDAKKGWRGKSNCIPVEQLVADWIKLGAVFIGGCCRVSANDIARIKDVVDAVMHSEKAMKGQ